MQFASGAGEGKNEKAMVMSNHFVFIPNYVYWLRKANIKNYHD